MNCTPLYLFSSPKNLLSTCCHDYWVRWAYYYDVHSLAMEKFPIIDEEICFTCRLGIKECATTKDKTSHNTSITSLPLPCLAVVLKVLCMPGILNSYVCDTALHPIQGLTHEAYVNLCRSCINTRILYKHV